MKKIIIVIMAAMLVSVMAGSALAVDVATAFHGNVRVRGIALNNMDANDDTADHQNFFDSRYVLGITCATSEDLSGTLILEVGDVTWGVEGTGGRVGADEIVVEVKNAFLLYRNDTATLVFGIQPLKTSKGILLDDDLAAIKFVAEPMDDMVLYGALAKIQEDTTNYDRDIDGYLVGANYNFTPEITAGAYVALIDSNIGAVAPFPSGQGGVMACDSLQAYWVGFTGVAEFDMINLSADLIINAGTAKDVSTGSTTQYQADGTTVIAPPPGASTTDIDLMGFAVDLRGEVDIDAGVGLKVGAVIAYASGDDDWSDDQIDAFITLDPAWQYFNNIWNDGEQSGEGGYGLHSADGLSDPLGFMGFGVYVKADPTEKLNVMLNFTNMNYVEDNSAGDTDIGNEIDLNCVYNINAALNLKGMLGALIPGEAFPYKNSDNDDLVTEYIVSLEYVF